MVVTPALVPAATALGIFVGTLVKSEQQAGRVTFFAKRPGPTVYGPARAWRRCT